MFSFPAVPASRGACPRRSRRSLPSALVATVAVVVLAACSSGSENDSPGVTLDGTGGSVTIEAHDPASYNANRIDAAVGDLTVKLVQTGSIVHDFQIDGIDGKAQVTGSEREATATFVGLEAGEYEYFCGTPGHRAMGMKGVLVVTE